MGPERLGLSGIIFAACGLIGLFSDLGLDILGTRLIATDKSNAREPIDVDRRSAVAAPRRSGRRLDPRRMAVRAKGRRRACFPGSWAFP